MVGPLVVINGSEFLSYSPPGSTTLLFRENPSGRYHSFLYPNCAHYLRLMRSKDFNEPPYKPSALNNWPFWFRLKIRSVKKIPIFYLSRGWLGGVKIVQGEGEGKSNLQRLMKNDYPTNLGEKNGCLRLGSRLSLCSPLYCCQDPFFAFYHLFLSL